ncbi:hypothetical protein SAMN05192529_107116 [Arachidicoccus rhizosphaerae]|uniref:AB hydrolase-1 domain-containing protein n=2 Tax=Arachidicoccus rhizosphaerae TaxID=551991 RepID=A0A1H3Y6X5_9BACT|nr:hypothetical protein SAMN05192529_107116 [Arachidicoccus rhizosphaerae]
MGTNITGRQAVCFQSKGLNIAAELYIPQSATFPTAGIIVGHPGSGVKEQTAALYARLFSERGWIVLTFDAAYQGESEGYPRGQEDPGQRVEDFKCAVTYLSTLDIVDPDKIGLFGICASGGYVISAAASDIRVKAVATVIAADIHRQLRYGGDGKQAPSVIANMLNAAASDKAAVLKGALAGSFPLFPANEEEARTLGQHVYEGWEYYNTDRGQHPRSAKTLTWQSVELIATFDAFAFIRQITPRPLLMISGSEAATLWMTKDAFEKAAQPKEIMIIDGASHMALYDNLNYVTQAVNKTSDFFKSALLP